MKSICLAVLLVTGLVCGTAAQANEALAKSKNCFACHAIDRKLVGPSYRDVARRYAGKPGSEAALVEKVLKGGKGVWAKELGAELPMPPNTMVKPAEAAQLVQWILSLE